MDVRTFDNSELPGRPLREGPWTASHRSCSRRSQTGPCNTLSTDDGVIGFDAANGTPSVPAGVEKLSRRRADWLSRETGCTTGAIGKYARMVVGPATKGAVTHPIGAAEEVCYADQ